jgi:hypothetical protein
MVAKFVLGLDAAAPPLAGLSGTTRLRFLAFDAVGAALWSGAYAGIGYVFGKDMDRASAYVASLGTLLALVVLAGLAIYVVRRVVRWRRFMGEFQWRASRPKSLNRNWRQAKRSLLLSYTAIEVLPRTTKAFPARSA